MHSLLGKAQISSTTDKLYVLRMVWLQVNLRVLQVSRIYRRYNACGDLIYTVSRWFYLHLEVFLPALFLQCKFPELTKPFDWKKGGNRRFKNVISSKKKYEKNQCILAAVYLYAQGKHKKIIVRVYFRHKCTRHKLSQQENYPVKYSK